jgi:hypothetical protein
MAQKFKTRKKYRLTLVNENAFNAVWTIKLSRLKVWLLSILAVASVAALTWLLMAVTPLSTLLPGYLRPEQRRDHIVNTLRVDSLAERSAQVALYLTNLRNIIEGTVEADSAATSEAVETDDTLMVASATERQFVEQWSERERFNLSTLTPLATDAMAFHSPSAGARPAPEQDSADPLTLALLVPRQAPVTAMSRGTVVDVHSTDRMGFTVMVQHPDNFLSHYGGLTNVSVTVGQKLLSGDVLGRSDGRLYIRMWHNGSPLNPTDVLAL